jgi:hypothetical protein
VLTHKIIKFRPKIKAGNVIPLPGPYQKQNFSGLRDSPTTEEYHTYLANNPLKLGDYVTYKYLPSGAENLFRVNYVFDILEECPQKTFLEWFEGRPRVYRLIQLDIFSTGKPWIRRDTGESFRVLSSQEFEATVIPHNDLIRDYINKHVRSKTNEEIEALTSP